MISQGCRKESCWLGTVALLETQLLGGPGGWTGVLEQYPQSSRSAGQTKSPPLQGRGGRLFPAPVPWTLGLGWVPSATFKAVKVEEGELGVSGGPPRHV